MLGSCDCGWQRLVSGLPGVFKEVAEYVVLLIVGIVCIFPNELSLLLLAFQSRNCFFVARLYSIIHQFVYHRRTFGFSCVGITYKLFEALGIRYCLSVRHDFFILRLLGGLMRCEPCGVIQRYFWLFAHETCRELESLTLLDFRHDLKLAFRVDHLTIFFVDLHMRLLLFPNEIGSLQSFCYRALNE